MRTVSWTENETPRTARWHSENETPAPTRIVVADDRLSANAALRLGRSGAGLLWRGDFQNARQLLAAVGRRLPTRSSPVSEPGDLGTLFRAHRKARSERAVLLGKILIALEHDHSIRLPRAPDVRAACAHAYGAPRTAAGDALGGTTLVSLPELLGVVGAYEWQPDQECSPPFSPA